jgi:serine phosphatase RsbU (regulator of sigma subunit)
MNRFLILILLNIILNNIVNSQTTKEVDSLYLKLQTSGEDTNKVIILNQISEILSDSKPDQALKFAQQGYLLSRSLDYKKGISSSISHKGQIFQIKGDYNKSLQCFEEALKINSEINNKIDIGENEKHIGIIYEYQRKYDKALLFYLKSLKNKEEIKDIRGIASGYNNIANIYLFQNNLNKAKEYYFKALKLVNDLKFKIGIESILSNLASVYFSQDSSEKAIEYDLKSLKVGYEIDNKPGIALTLNNIGNYYQKINRNTQALDYYKKSIAIREELGDINGIAGTYISIGNLFTRDHNFSLAIDYINKGLTISKKSGDLELIKISYENLADIYAQIKDFEKAFMNHVEFSKIDDSIFNKENSRAISELQEQFNAKEREHEIKLKNTEIQKNELQIKQQKTFQTALIIGILLLVLLAIVIFNSNLQKKKANILLACQNEEILAQKSIIEEKNRDILASITYAKRNQDAILPPDKTINQILSNYFILFKPKDIVSGDFYWFNHKDNKLFFSVVDCTGHGVPGAFMSIVGYNGLNQAVNEASIPVPGKLLDKLSNIVEMTLHQSGKYDVKDGMDLALCSIDSDLNLLEYAGAYNSLYIVRNSLNDLIVNDEKMPPSASTGNGFLYEIKADKQPIGAFSERHIFTNYTIILEKDDLIYVFSDGFADQFGGPLNKKFKYKPFKELLLNISEKTLEEQKTELGNTIEEWRGKNEQVDDICVIGIKY